MGCCTVLVVLAFLELQLFARGQNSTSEPLSSEITLQNELAEQLIEIHREIIKMQMSINDSQRNPINPPGGVHSLTQQINRMLIYALPGVLGQTVGIVQDGNFAFLGGDDNADGVGDYQLSENVKQSVKQASRTVPNLSSSFFKSLETLQVISSNLMPTTKYEGAAPVYTGCHDAFLKGARSPGVYSILRDRHLKFRAWCDFDESGGWTVIQRRFDGTVNFGRPWEQYVNGFGSLWGEYWLGLRQIYQLTRDTVKLSIYFEDLDRSRHTLSYSSFSVGDVSTNYRLNIGGYNAGPYDCMAYNNGSQFSTWDQDRDTLGGDNCAMRSSGGWWFNVCTYFNPNGRYDGGPESEAMHMSAYTGVWTRMAVVVMRINV